MSSRRSVLFILPVLGQPRHAKRIDMIRQQGFKVAAASFERAYHKGRMPSCEVSILARIEDGKHLRRLLVFISVLPKIRSLAKQFDIVYASGPDMGLLGVIATMGLKKPVVFEVGDVQHAQVKPGLKGRLIRALDAWTGRNSRLIVSTSSGYIDHYYRGMLGVPTPALIMENKLEPAKRQHQQSDKKRRRSSRPIVIGYFGLLRCAWSWDVLEQLVSRWPEDFSVVVAGRAVNSERLRSLTESYLGIEYRGEYRSPEDLPGLYDSVDIVWATYPLPQPTEKNWQWARTNRFYESCRFSKPMIVLENSGDEPYVTEYGLGVSVPADSPKVVAEELALINKEKIANWQKNVSSLPRYIYEYESEFEALEVALKKVCG